MGTFASPDNDICVVRKDPCTMVPAIPGAAANVPGTGTALAGAGEVETSRHSGRWTGHRGVANGSGAGIFWGRKTSSYFVRHPELPIDPILPEGERGVVAQLKLHLKL